ncbi:MAG: hypothetical protein ABJG68_06335 [Crocinitomicaceae bacterium]
MPEPKFVETSTDGQSIHCEDKGCEGTYIGPEFEGFSDVAHQFSNTMSAKVGDQLKILYENEQYAKVNFSEIQMTTKGMGTGHVTYYLSIPFIKVETACEAYTSFDHCGGWDHSPAIDARKKQLQKALLPGETLDISELKTTEEGLQEYWIQWKNKTVQAKCK